MNSQMEEQYEKPRQCGWKILKGAMARAHKKDEEERKAAEKNDQQRICGLLMNQLFDMPEKEFKQWVEEHKEIFSRK